MLLAGCAAPSAGIEDPEATAEETALPENAPDVVGSDAVTFEAISSVATCIFTSEELTAAYASWSAYVAGPAAPDTSTTQASCEYAHADQAQQYISVPFTIWVEAYSYLDPYVAMRAGLESVPAPGGIDRAAIASYYCPPDGDKPPALAAVSVVCEESSSGAIIVFDNYRALIVRDDIIWEVVASGSTSPVNTAERDSLLRVARLAAERTI